jgi:hypothetical protein
VRRSTIPSTFEEQWLPHRQGERNTLVTHKSNYNSSLKAAFGALQLREIDAHRVQRWVTKMARDNYSAGTIRAKFMTLQTVLATRSGPALCRSTSTGERRSGLGQVAARGGGAVTRPPRAAFLASTFFPRRARGSLIVQGHRHVA